MTEMTQVISSQPKGFVVPQLPNGVQALDQLSIDKLQNVQNFGLEQGKFLMEAATCGCAPNSYVITDRQRQVQCGEQQIDTPLFVVEETSDCCCRVCCGPHHPFLAKVYHALPAQPGRTVCGRYMGPDQQPDRTRPPVMTLERDGCCNKWYGCWVCTPKCGQEMSIHAGNVDGKPGQLPDTMKIATSTVPVGGGGFHPVIEVRPQGSSEPAAFVQGPTCFGGCLDLCTDTFFTFSRNKDASGDIGTMKKLKPDTCWELCKATCSDVDRYQVDFQPDPSISPFEKATLLGEAVHLDYMLFDQDNDFCRVEDTGGSVVIYINMCLCYCYGCLCPCEICIPIPKNS